MPSTRYVVLPESTESTQFVDDPIFTEVTDDGETYTTFRIERVTHRIVDHPKDWNFLAAVKATNVGVSGVAFLKVRDRTILDAKVERFEAPG